MMIILYQSTHANIFLFFRHNFIILAKAL